MLLSHGGCILSWGRTIIGVREAHLRAIVAEYAADWPIAVKEYLLCLEAAEHAADLRATRFFATKLARAYSAMGFSDKARRYLELVALAAG